MTRPVPFCRSIMAAAVAAGKASRIVHESDLLCLGSRCSMWHVRRDSTPATNLGCCAENPTAVPWVDPAAKESK